MLVILKKKVYNGIYASRVRKIHNATLTIQNYQPAKASEESSHLQGYTQAPTRNRLLKFLVVDPTFSDMLGDSRPMQNFEPRPFILVHVVVHRIDMK